MSPIQNNAVSSCETSVLYTGGGPNINGAVVQINEIDLIPSPFLNISLEKYKMGEVVIGGLMKISLNGIVTGDSFNDVSAGILAILNLGLVSSCVPVVIQCADQFIDGYGRIVSVSSNEGSRPTWVNMAPYSIEIELYENQGSKTVDADYYNVGSFSDNGLSSLMLKSLSESFTLTLSDDSFNWELVTGTGDTAEEINVGNRHAKVSFSISAAGIGGCGDSDLTYGLEAAQDAILYRIASLKNMDLSSVADKPEDIDNELNTYRNGSSYLDFRSIEVNILENSLSVNGDIIYRPYCCLYPGVFTTLTVDEQISSEGNDITISGNIVGLVDMQYENVIKNNMWISCYVTDKIGYAKAFLGLLNDEAQLTSIALAHKTKSSITDTCSQTLFNNPCPSLEVPPSSSPEFCEFRLTSSQISTNYGDGQINFSFVLSNKQNCTILGARKVDVTISHEYPRDNIVEILIPGRGDKGVLIQNLCCKSAEKYSISIDATLNTNLCAFKDTVKIEALKLCAEALLETLKTDGNVDVSCWFVTNHQDTLGNTSYRLSQEYTKPSCP